MEAEKASNSEVSRSADGVHSVPVAAGAGDTNICGGIVQLYWDFILGRSLDVNEHVRQGALKVVMQFTPSVCSHPFFYSLCLVVQQIWNILDIYCIDNLVI